MHPALWPGSVFFRCVPGILDLNPARVGALHCHLGVVGEVIQEIARHKIGGCRSVTLLDNGTHPAGSDQSRRLGASRFLLGCRHVGRLRLGNCLGCHCYGSCGGGRTVGATRQVYQDQEPGRSEHGILPGQDPNPRESAVTACTSVTTASGRPTTPTACEGRGPEDSVVSDQIHVDVSVLFPVSGNAQPNQGQCHGKSNLDSSLHHG